MRGKLAIALSAVVLILLPAAGLVGGGFGVYQSLNPEVLDCGLCFYPLLLVIGCGALLGLAAGVGVGWVLTLGLFRWANRCGLGDARDEPPGI